MGVQLLTLVCAIIGVVIILFVITVIFKLLFPGPEISQGPPPYMYQQPGQSPYTQREYPPRSYPPQQAQPPKEQITYCQGCGKQIPPDARLCPYCGKGLDYNSPSP